MKKARRPSPIALKASPVASAKTTRARAVASGGLIRGRFARARLPEVEAFTASLPFDRRLFRHDIRGSVAHARMLAKARVCCADAERKIVKGLERIEREIDTGSFRFDLADEDIHLAIERRLIETDRRARRKLQPHARATTRSRSI